MTQLKKRGFATHQPGKVNENSTEFSKTTSQNANHVPLSDLLLLIHSSYLGPSLRLPFIDMAT